MNNAPKFLILDLFCGCGGASYGFAESTKVKVIAGINHDEEAIQTFKHHFPRAKVFREDIRDVPMDKLKAVIDREKKQYPLAYLLLWASPDCTNHTVAKGGKPKDPDSRTLAWDLDRYVDILKPDYVKIENVREFMQWGPLDEECQPIKAERGVFFWAWRHHIRQFGYRDDWRMLNAADYGAYTSRNRLFGCFYRPHLPMAFPKPTHDKTARNGLKRWRPVREVLELEEHGESIFTRKDKAGNPKMLKESTLVRLLAGLKRHVGSTFLSLYYSSGTRWWSIDVPGPTLSTKDRAGLVTPQFLLKKYSAAHNHQSVERPGGTIVTIPKDQLVTAQFLDATFRNEQGRSLDNPNGSLLTKDHYSLVTSQFIEYGFTGQSGRSIEVPAGALTTKDHHSLVTVSQWLLKYNSMTRDGEHKPPSIDDPSPVITTDPQLGLVSAFLLNPQWKKDSGTHLEKPCFTLIARMDKAPPYLVVTEFGNLAIAVYETDSPTMIKIKEFMAAHGIVDIKMRMLMEKELLRIQGFPDDYWMAGNLTTHKKFIGNSVVPAIPDAWALELDKLIA